MEISTGWKMGDYANKYLSNSLQVVKALMMVLAAIGLQQKLRRDILVVR